MKRTAPVSDKSKVHCCEDHFNIETDMVNYIKYKLVGGRLQIKNDVVPHKFLCQEPQDGVKGASARKRRKAENTSTTEFNVDLPTTSDINIRSEMCFPSSSNTGNENSLDCFETNYEDDTDPLSVYSSSNAMQIGDEPKIHHKSTMTQNLAKFRSRATQTGNARLSLQETHIDADFDCRMTNNALQCISINPQLHIGIPRKCYFTIVLLTEQCQCTHRDIMITLKKIRLHLSDAVLAMDFGAPIDELGKIFRKTLPAVAACMKKMVFFPDFQDVVANLPIPFRRRYSNVQSIINCVEIRIEKPVSQPKAAYQALAWSEHKRCYTMKYLISFTPDGLINFVSEGYGGKTPYHFMFEDCGILEKVPRNCAVVTDQDFKGLAQLLLQKGCILIRPSRSLSDRIFTKENVMETHEIGALRPNVERTIERMRHFGYVMPHACVESSEIDILDFIIVTVCGLTNLQSSL